MIDLAILNGKVYHDNKFVDTNVYVDGETIYAITTEKYPAKREVDATGLLVLPGIIDPHVHFDLDLGYTRSADNFERGSLLGALGGVTTVVDFLDPAQTPSDLESKYRRRVFEAEDSKIDYMFHACIKVPRCDLEEFVRKMLSLGMNSLKCFTTYSDSGRMTKDEDIVKLLELSEKYRFLLMVHAEEDSLIKNDPSFTFRDLGKSRPKEAEIQKALQLAGFVTRYGGFLYMAHVSSGETIEALKKDFPEIMNRRFFIESCPHYFVFDDGMLQRDDGYLYTMAPPLRSKLGKMYLNEDIDWVYSIGTDHCSFTKYEKRHELLSEIPLGIGSIEHSFDIMYNLFGNKVIDKMTKHPAQMNGIDHRKGKIKAGYDADLFLYRLGKGVINEDHSASDYSIYKGVPKSGTVVSTLVRGNFIVLDREFGDNTGKLVEGRAL